MGRSDELLQFQELQEGYWSENKTNSGGNSHGTMTEFSLRHQRGFGLIFAVF